MLTSNGKVFASGANSFGNLGDGTEAGSASPVQVKAGGSESVSGFLEDVKMVAAGGGYSLALKNDGTVWAWGNNALVGTGPNPSASKSLTPVPVRGGESGDEFLKDVDAIAQKASHVLALMKDGTVLAWGSEAVGNGSGGSATPVRVKGGDSGLPFLTDVKAIDTGTNHSLAAKDDGTVWAWGENVYRQLGDGTTTERATPVQVQGSFGGVKVVSVSAGEKHSAALTENGRVWVWGQDASKWGLGDEVGSGTPVEVQVGGVGGVTAISAGWDHVLASKSGEVWAWGSNQYGQLGDDSTTRSATPVQVKGPAGVGSLVGATALSAAGRWTSLAVVDGAVLGWGSNGGLFGNGDWERSLVPVGLSVGRPPENDAFAASKTLIGTNPVGGARSLAQALPANHELGTTTGNTTGTNRFATKETGEPSHAPGATSAGKSVWYQWTAPLGVVGNVPFSTKGSNFNTTMSAYTAQDPSNPSLSNLIPVAQNDDNGTNNWSRLEVPAAPGVVYYIAIDGASSDAAPGAIELRWGRMA